MKWIYCISLICVLSSCSNFLDDYSQDLVIPQSVSDFDELLLGNGYLPRKQVSELRAGGLTWWVHLLDDDVNTVTEASALRGLFDMDSHYFGYTTWQFEVGRSYDQLNLRDDNGDWDELYKRINSLNIILEEIENIPQDIEKDRKDAYRIKGEAHFLRAQFYLTLVNLYAPMYNPNTAERTLGVPLKLTSFVEHDNKKEAQFERASVASVYAQIIKDLEKSVENFDQGSKNKGSYRSSKEAAMLLLSRTHLYMQDWVNAKTWGMRVIESKGSLQNYAFIAEDEVVIGESNDEILFAQGPLNVQNMFTARGGDFCVTADLYHSYADEDYRKSLYFSKSSFTDSIAIGRKFKKELHISPVSDLFLLRTSEAYLNTIEALAMNGDIQQAKELLTTFRSYRMSSPEVNSATEEELVSKIREERRKEFCFEGHRWFDLRRYAQANKHMFNKEIIRSFTSYNWNDKNKAVKVELYKLNSGDLAYTFAIPKLVVDFDRGLPNNERELRKPFQENKLN
jgi:hypothetical protein